MYSINNLHKDPPTLLTPLHTQYVGRRIIWYRRLASTQELAKDLINENGTSKLGGYVIIADSQECGTGRGGRKWVSPRGGIWLSVILGSTLHPSKCTLFSFCASLAVCEAINDCTGLDSKLKWPNDVIINGKKVSGVLVDASVNSGSIEYVVVGIGVNVNVGRAEVQRKIGVQTPQSWVTSLSDELGSSCDKARLIKKILQTLDSHYLRMERDDNYCLIEKWKQSAEDIASKHVHLTHGAEEYTAKVLGLEEDGSLIVARDNNRIERIVSAEYSLRFTV